MNGQVLINASSIGAAVLYLFEDINLRLKLWWFRRFYLIYNLPTFFLIIYLKIDVEEHNSSSNGI